MDRTIIHSKARYDVLSEKMKPMGDLIRYSAELCYTQLPFRIFFLANKFWHGDF